MEQFAALLMKGFLEVFFLLGLFYFKPYYSLKDSYQQAFEELCWLNGLQNCTKKKKTVHFLDGAHSHTPKVRMVKYHQSVCSRSVPCAVLYQSKHPVQCLGAWCNIYSHAVLRYNVTQSFPA